MKYGLDNDLSEGYFKSIADGIVFGHNPNAGGSIKIGINKIVDLYFN